VELMNEKAKALGMKCTKFCSVHGLPPAAGQEVDMTTPRDLAILARALILQHPEALKYTATKARTFRPEKDEKTGKMNLTSHNHLLEQLAGCDGMKTGYIKAGGYSNVITASRNGHRVITVGMGSGPQIDFGRLRDMKAAEITNRAFAALAGGK
jgi:serine-type D-Ala-D-Ala carboxypeptidase (penicillin-binding protein 5/6)